MTYLTIYKNGIFRLSAWSWLCQCFCARWWCTCTSRRRRRRYVCMVTEDPFWGPSPCATELFFKPCRLGCSNTLYFQHHFVQFSLLTTGHGNQGGHDSAGCLYVNNRDMASLAHLILIFHLPIFFHFFCMRFFHLISFCLYGFLILNVWQRAW